MALDPPRQFPLHFLIRSLLKSNAKWPWSILEPLRQFSLHFLTSSSRPMAVDREFVYIGFGPDGPPLAPHGASTGSHVVAMGLTWAPHGIQLGPRAKNIDFP